MQPNILCFVGMGKKDQISYGAAKHALGCAFYAQKQDCGCWIDAAICDALSPEEAARAAGFASIYSTYRFYEDQRPASQRADGHILQRCAGGSERKGWDPDRAVRQSRTTAGQPAFQLSDSGSVCRRSQTPGTGAVLIDRSPRPKRPERDGSRALLGVNQGSGKGAYLITLTYTNAGDAPYTALVGKGITFDSGGYTLKPRTSMSGMKFDMCGAANALCTLELAARRQAKVNLMAILAVTENMIGPDAYTVDDVLVSLSGQTIEVTNTDAEGRLILCDALTHASNKQAARIIDLATADRCLHHRPR